MTDEKFTAGNPKGNPNPTLQYSYTVKVAVTCKMHFEMFPFDEQTCAFLMKSLKDEKSLFWRKPDIKSSLFSHPEFITRIEDSKETEVKINNETVKIAGFNFIIGRKITTYIYSYFLPCFLMVLSSWISFAVNFEAI